MQPEHSPQVTVSMCLYNGERFLREAIDSILSQTYTDFELLIYDDGSTDNTIAIVESYSDHRIRLVKSAENRGLAYARQKTLELALGRYMVLQDGDDISLPTRIEEEVHLLTAEPTVGATGCWIQAIDENGRPTSDHSYDTLNLQYSMWIKWIFLTTTPFHPLTYRIDLAREVGGYEFHAPLTYSPVFEDYLFGSRLSQVAPIKVVPKILMYYRLHPETITKRIQGEARLQHIVPIIQHQLQNYLGEEIPEEIVAVLRQMPSVAQPAVFSIPLASPAFDIHTTAISLYLKLYSKFCAENPLSSQEKAAIHQDTTQEILRLIGHMRPFAMGTYFIRQQQPLFWLLASPCRLFSICLKALWKRTMKRF
jgi:hypothetical protein